MRRVRWPVAVAAALALSAGSVVAAREHLAIAGPLFTLGAVLVGAWVALIAQKDDDDHT